MLMDTRIRNARLSGALFKLFDSRDLYLHVMSNGGSRGGCPTSYSAGSRWEEAARSK